jgi:hypothetical protein
MMSLTAASGAQAEEWYLRNLVGQALERTLPFRCANSEALAGRSFSMIGAGPLETLSPSSRLRDHS